MVWCGKEQGRARRLLSPGSLKTTYCSLGEGCRGPLRRGGKVEGRDRRSLPPTLVHRAHLGRPQPGWLRRGTCSGLSFALQPGFLAFSLSLSFPSPLLQNDVSTARRRLMRPWANQLPGRARCCSGGGNQWDRGAGAGEGLGAFFPPGMQFAGARERRGLERKLGSRGGGGTEDGPGENLAAKSSGVGSEDVNGDLRQARRSSTRHPRPPPSPTLH